jgi:hypothetical protein
MPADDSHTTPLRVLSRARACAGCEVTVGGGRCEHCAWPQAHSRAVPAACSVARCAVIAGASESGWSDAVLPCKRSRRPQRSAGYLE